MIRRFAGLIILIFVSFCFLACAQFKQGLRLNDKKFDRGGQHTVGKVTFSLPEHLEVRDDGESDNIFLGYSPEHKYGVMLGVLKPGDDKIVFAADICEKGLRDFYSLYPTKDMKEIKSTRDAVFSKFETQPFIAQSFHTRERVFTNLRRINFNDKQFFIGYLTIDESENSRDSFDKNIDMESVTACASVIEIIASITGERFDENSNPCRKNNRPASKTAGNN